MKNKLKRLSEKLTQGNSIVDLVKTALGIILVVVVIWELLYYTILKVADGLLN